MKRESNYDLLRITSAVAVIMVHVSAAWYTSTINKVAEYGINTHEIQAAFISCFYNSTSRFAVPCFIMLSGAFILDNKENAGYKSFYSRSFAKIGVPTIVFSALYIMYRLSWWCVWGVEIKSGLVILLKDILKGSPMSICGICIC